PPSATAYAAAGVPLADDALIEAFINLGEVPVAPYAAPSTEEVPDSIAPLLKDHDAVLLANHGALTVGVDLMHAYFAMETLEHWAQISLNAKLLGGAKPIPQEKLDQLYRLRNQYYHCTGRHPYDTSRPDLQK
ncbi:MAG TPA: class II aldolase/adducin family protein, partial [Oscillospiraceae bacterium]|nr:class II aldolase/adducin family protein [Oscillospiraceae bacterium]